MGARNRVGIGLPYRPAMIHRLAESIPGLLKSLKMPSLNVLDGSYNIRLFSNMLNERARERWYMNSFIFTASNTRIYTFYYGVNINTRKCIVRVCFRNIYVYSNSIHLALSYFMIFMIIDY